MVSLLDFDSCWGVPTAFKDLDFALKKKRNGLGIVALRTERATITAVPQPKVVFMDTCKQTQARKTTCGK